MKLFKTNSFNPTINAVANVLVLVFAVLMAISAMFCVSNFFFGVGDKMSTVVLILANVVAILLITVQYRLYLNETELSSMKESSFAMKFITFFGGGYKGYIISFCMLLTSFVYPARISSVFQLAFIWLEYVTVLSVLYYQARENVINQQTNYETLSV